MICPNCNNDISDSARFCKHCGAQVVRERVAMATVPQETPVPPTACCSSCGAVLRPNAKFCASCGASVGGSQPPRQQVWQQPTPVHRPRPMGDHLRSPGARSGLSMPRSVNSAVKSLSKAGKIAAAGGAAAFLGCLLPLESSSGMQSAVLPGIFEVMQSSGYAAILLVLPLSAVAVVVMTLSAMSGSGYRRAMLGGATIAVSSPWAIFFVIAIFAANKFTSALGPLAGGASVGIGALLLAAGFGVALAGGFMILKEAIEVVVASINKMGG